MILSDKVMTPDRNARAALSILCEARQGMQPWQRVRLNDLSPRGFQVSWRMPVNPRQVLRLRIPGMTPLSAHIRWHDKKVLGCEFEAPLHVAVFDHIVRSAGLSATGLR